jgi:hypothetical protein
MRERTNSGVFTHDVNGFSYGMNDITPDVRQPSHVILKNWGSSVSGEVLERQSDEISQDKDLGVDVSCGIL